MRTWLVRRTNQRIIRPSHVSSMGSGSWYEGTGGWRQLFLPLATFILAGLEPSSLVHHRAVWRQGRQKLRFRVLLNIAALIERRRSFRSGVLLLPATSASRV